MDIAGNIRVDFLLLIHKVLLLAKEIYAPIYSKTLIRFNAI